MPAPDIGPRQAAAEWLRCSLPAAIAEWLSTLQGKRANVYLQRAARFVQCADQSHEQQEQLLKAWRAVTGPPARPGHDAPELAVFIALPDRVALNPYPALYPGRSFDSDTLAIENRRYVQLGEQSAAVRLALHPESLEAILQDAGANDDARRVAGEFQKNSIAPVVKCLLAFEAMLRATHPADKVPTAQPGAHDAAEKVFAGQVAMLNRHLARPKHAALVALAKVNCPGAKLSADQVRHAWSRADKHA